MCKRTALAKNHCLCMFRSSLQFQNQIGHHLLINSTTKPGPLPPPPPPPQRTVTWTGFFFVKKQMINFSFFSNFMCRYRQKMFLIRKYFAPQYCHMSVINSWFHSEPTMYPLTNHITASTNHEWAQIPSVFKTFHFLQDVFSIYVFKINPVSIIDIQ